jgi:hypothetical protein
VVEQTTSVAPASSSGAHPLVRAVGGVVVEPETRFHDGVLTVSCEEATALLAHRVRRGVR